MDIQPISGHEPPFWIVVFCRKTTVWWTRWLACGRFRHVKACAPIPELSLWIFYDVTLTDTRVMVAPLATAAGIWCNFTADADLIRIRRDPRGVRLVRFGFWCVPAIKHLIGLRSGALRPDALYRDCLAHGGELIRGQFVEKPDRAAAIRPAAA